MLSVKYRDLRITDICLREQYIQAIESVYNHGRFIMGPEVFELENALQVCSDMKFCISVNSGTFALATDLFEKRISHKNVILPSIS